MRCRFLALCGSTALIAGVLGPDLTLAGLGLALLAARLMAVELEDARSALADALEQLRSSR